MEEARVVAPVEKVNKKKTISCLAMEPLVCAINTD
jgi:hypothetical protein